MTHPTALTIDLAVIEEAAQVLESAAAHNRAKCRTVLAHDQQDRADRLRLMLPVINAALSAAEKAGYNSRNAEVYQLITEKWELESRLAAPAATAEPNAWRGSLAQVVLDVPLPERNDKYQLGFVDAKEAILRALREAGFDRATPATHHVSAPIAEPCAPAILEALSWHAFERDDLTLEEAVEAIRHGYKKVRQRTDRQMLIQLAHLMASAPEAVSAPSAQQDAARYQWLLKQFPGSLSLDLDCGIGEISETIDAAMSTSPTSTGAAKADGAETVCPHCGVDRLKKPCPGMAGECAPMRTWEAQMADGLNLLPCAHCGSADVQFVSPGGPEERSCDFVICNGCGLSAVRADCEGDPVEVWNRRAPPAPSTAPSDELPPLPEGVYMPGVGPHRFYSAEQMQAYARAALANKKGT